jgi:hypothetical protein
VLHTTASRQFNRETDTILHHHGMPERTLWTSTSASRMWHLQGSLNAAAGLSARPGKVLRRDSHLSGYDRVRSLQSCAVISYPGLFCGGDGQPRPVSRRSFLGLMTRDSDRTTRRPSHKSLYYSHAMRRPTIQELCENHINKY